jgi:PAS domain S-box-containing protein
MTARVMVVTDNSPPSSGGIESGERSTTRIEDQLAHLGYEIVSVAGGAQAVEQAEMLCPDLALVEMASLGVGASRVTRCLQRELNVPVVCVIDAARPAVAQSLYATQPYGYVLESATEAELHLAMQMALQRHAAEQVLQEDQQWLATVLESIGDAVIATDAQGRIQFMNSVAQALTGWSQDEAWGRHLSQVFTLVDGEANLLGEDPVTRVLAEDGVVELGSPGFLLTREGMQVAIDDNAAPIRDRTGRISGVVLVFRDVSGRSQDQQRMRQYAAELEARNKELDAFAHTVAHDLKDPLSVIVGCVSVLREDYATMSEEQRDTFFQIMSRVGNQTYNIVDELLLLAAMRRSEVESGPLEMARIVKTVQQRLAHMIEEYHAELIVPDDWPIAIGYSPWIEEVWVNYISNGIKYGGQPPRLELGAQVQPDGRVRFWISDNGAGIAPEECQNLFTPFTQLDRARATGHGLGLSIVRRILDKLGGEVEVESQVGRGSKFTFTLPGA